MFINDKLVDLDVSVPEQKEEPVEVLQVEEEAIEAALPPPPNTEELPYLKFKIKTLYNKMYRILGGSEV